MTDSYDPADNAAKSYDVAPMEPAGALEPFRWLWEAITSGLVAWFACIARGNPDANSYSPEWYNVERVLPFFQWTFTVFFCVEMLFFIVSLVLYVVCRIVSAGSGGETHSNPSSAQ